MPSPGQRTQHLKSSFKDGQDLLHRWHGTACHVRLRPWRRFLNAHLDNIHNVNFIWKPLCHRFIVRLMQIQNQQVVGHLDLASADWSLTSQRHSAKVDFFVAPALPSPFAQRSQLHVWSCCLCSSCIPGSIPRRLSDLGLKIIQNDSSRFP